MGSDQGIAAPAEDQYDQPPFGGAVMVCSHCEKPTYFPGVDDVNYMPTPAPGMHDLSLPDNVSALYQEARKAMGAGLYVATAMLCRALLSHAAVTLGAEEGKSFFHYIEWLGANHYVPPNAKPWLTFIRELGNLAAHQLQVVSHEDARRSLKFTGVLLLLTHDLPGSFDSASPLSKKKH